MRQREFTATLCLTLDAGDSDWNGIIKKPCAPGEVTYRVWRAYMAMAAYLFRQGRLSLYHTMCESRGRAYGPSAHPEGLVRKSHLRSSSSPGSCLTACISTRGAQSCRANRPACGRSTVVQRGERRSHCSMSKPATRGANRPDGDSCSQDWMRWLMRTTISQVGDGVSKVALLWFVYAMTDSALKMSLIGVLQTIPPLLFGLCRRALDRIDKRRAMIVIDVVRTTAVVDSHFVRHGLVVFACALCAGIRDCHVLHGLRAGVERHVAAQRKKDQLTRINAHAGAAMTRDNPRPRPQRHIDCGDRGQALYAECRGVPYFRAVQAAAAPARYPSTPHESNVWQQAVKANFKTASDSSSSSSACCSS